MSTYIVCWTTTQNTVAKQIFKLEAFIYLGMLKLILYENKMNLDTYI